MKLVLTTCLALLESQLLLPVDASLAGPWVGLGRDVLARPLVSTEGFFVHVAPGLAVPAQPVPDIAVAMTSPFLEMVVTTTVVFVS